MKHDYIKVDRDNIPYEYDITLSDENFRIGVEYNETAEFFTFRLSKLDEETGKYVEICAGEPIVYGMPLWNDVYRSGKFPALAIVPLDESGESNAVTYDNIEKTVFLMIDNL